MVRAFLRTPEKTKGVLHAIRRQFTPLVGGLLAEGVALS
jgi:hypothetical protein